MVQFGMQIQSNRSFCLIRFFSFSKGKTGNGRLKTVSVYFSPLNLLDVPNFLCIVMFFIVCCVLIVLDIPVLLVFCLFGP